MNLRLKKRLEDKRCILCGNTKPGTEIKIHRVSNMYDFKLMDSYSACGCGHQYETYVFITYYYLIQNLSYLYGLGGRCRSLVSPLHHRYIVQGILGQNVDTWQHPDLLKFYLDNPELMFEKGWVDESMDADIHISTVEYNNLYDAVQLSYKLSE